MSALRGTFYEWRWDLLSFSTLCFFMGLVFVLKDVEKDTNDVGRRRSAWVGHPRHSCAIPGLMSFMATGAIKVHHPSLSVLPDHDLPTASSGSAPSLR